MEKPSIVWAVPATAVVVALAVSFNAYSKEDGCREFYKDNVEDVEASPVNVNGHYSFEIPETGQVCAVPHNPAY